MSDNYRTEYSEECKATPAWQNKLTLVSLALLVFHLGLRYAPTLKEGKWPESGGLDSVGLALVFIALIPYLRPFLDLVKLPGGLEFAFRQLQRRQKEADKKITQLQSEVGKIQLESAIFNDVAMPGKQLGRLNEAVTELINIIELERPEIMARHPESNLVFKELLAMRDQIELKKTEKRTEYKSNVLSALKRLNKKDPQAFALLARNLPLEGISKIREKIDPENIEKGKKEEVEALAALSRLEGVDPAACSSLLEELFKLSE